MAKGTRINIKSIAIANGAGANNSSGTTTKDSSKNTNDGAVANNTFSDRVGSSSGDNHASNDGLSETSDVEVAAIQEKAKREEACDSN